MRVACLVPYPLGEVPSQRYRLEQWASPLAARDIHLDFFPFLDAAGFAVLYQRRRVLTKTLRLAAASLRRVVWTLRAADRYDVVVIHREATCFGMDWIERRLASRVPTLFDFDDAIWLDNVSAANRAFSRLKGVAKTDRILARVAAVSAGCGFLAEHARLFNEQVSVVPTSIDLSAYGAPRQHAASDTLVVGWTGSLTTAPYLAEVVPVLRQAGELTPLKLIVYGAQLDVAGVTTECIPWSAATEVDVLRRFDVGLKPMPREEWARGKCPMKELQYMALGIPPVATRFGTALEAIEHGSSGLLCASEGDWVEALLALRSAELRSRLGAAGRRTVEARYSAERAAGAFAAALERAGEAFARRRQPAPPGHRRMPSLPD